MAKIIAKQPNLSAAGKAKDAAQAAASYKLASIKIPTSPDLEVRLQAVERQIASLPFEVCVGFSRDGKEILRLKGNETTVKFTRKQLRLARGGYLTHNHPNGSCFSWQDIHAAHHLNLCEIRAVANLAAAEVYVVRRPTGGWDTNCCDELLLLEATRLRTKYAAIRVYMPEWADHQVENELHQYAGPLMATLHLTYQTIVL